MLTLVTICVSAGILLTVLALPLVWERVPPNWFYGFRVPATLRDRRLWYAVNRYAGQRLLRVGLLTTAGALGLSCVPGITADGYGLGVLILTGGAMSITVVQSFRYLHAL